MAIPAIDDLIKKNFAPLLSLGFTHAASKKLIDDNELFTHVYENTKTNRNVEVTVSLGRDGLATALIIISNDAGGNFMLLDWARANARSSEIASSLIEYNKSKDNLDINLKISAKALLSQLREILLGNKWIEVPLDWGSNR